MRPPPYVSLAGVEAWRVKIWVQPRAKSSVLAGEYQGCLKVRIASPPVDDKANREVCRYVAKILGLRPQQVSLESGQSSRQKVLLISSPAEPAWEALEVSALNRNPKDKE